MLVDQPYCEDTMIAGVSSRRFGHDSLLDLAAQGLLEPVCELLVGLGELLQLLLLSLVVVELEVLLVGTHELEALELGELWHGVLVDRVDVVEHLDALLTEALEVWRLLGSLLALSRDVVNVLLGSLL